jgi:hypothetical protein
MKHASKEVALAALKCTTTFLASVNTKDAKKMNTLLIPIFQCTYELFKLGDGEDAL